MEARTPRSDMLFDLPANGMQEEREETRRTLINLSQTAVSKRLRGTTPFDVNELDIVAGYFDMTLDRASDWPRPSRARTTDRGARAPATSVANEFIEDLAACGVNPLARSPSNSR